MTRSELYNTVTPCGLMPYTSMVYLINNVTFTDPSFQVVLLERLTQTGRLTREDWLLFVSQIEFIDGSPINAATVNDWLTYKCYLSASELKTFLNYVEFTDGSTSTYLLSETGDFLIAES